MPVPLHWHTEPFLLISLLLAGWLYAVGAGPLRARVAPPGTPYPRLKALAFYSALVLTYLAVGSPLDQIGEDYLFSAHMVQHMIIIYITPPLLLWGTPWWLADAVLTKPWVKRLVRPLVHPAICCVSFLVVFGIWHLPELYEAALRNRSLHILEHAMIFGSALQMWWVFLSPSRVLPPCGHLVQVVVAFCLIIGHMPIMGLLVLAEPLYPTYIYAPRIIPNFDALQDQTFGGMIMELSAVFISLVLLGAGFLGWAREEKNSQSRRNRPAEKSTPAPGDRPTAN